jgi:hypothetical protein
MLHLSRWGPRSLTLALLALAAGCGGSAADIVTADQPVEQPRSFDHSAYETLLADYVDERGMVDYAALKQHQSAALRPYLRRLARTDPANLDADERLAFWINAYNALAIKLIADNYPVESIRDIKPSGLPFIPKVNSPFKLDVGVVGGQTRTLDEIEHDVIRAHFVGTAEYDEPRIHVALVCAAMSCPELRQEAYTGVRLGEQLADQSRIFLQTESKNRIPAGPDRVRLSKIFDWYGSDFIDEDESKQEAVMAFAADYFERDVADKLRRGAYDVDYLDYDWSLNEQAGGRMARGE